MNNIIMRSIAVGAAYAPLVSAKLVASVVIQAPASNMAVVTFKGDDGSDVSWQPGDWYEFHHIDLNSVQVKGTVGDKVIVVGGSW